MTTSSNAIQPDGEQDISQQHVTKPDVKFKFTRKTNAELARYVIGFMLTMLTITLLALFFPHPTKQMHFEQHVQHEEVKRFAWVGGVTNTTAEFRVRLGAANGILTISQFHNMSSPIQSFELEGDWTREDQFATSNFTVYSLQPATWFYYTLTLSSIGLPGLDDDELIPDFAFDDDDDDDDDIIVASGTRRRRLEASKNAHLRILHGDDSHDDHHVDIDDDDWVRFDYQVGTPRVVHRGKFSTFATPGEPHSFRVGLGSCAVTHSNALAFDKLVAAELDLFIHMGDMHYQNIAVPDQKKFDKAYEDVFEKNKYRRLLSSQAIAYTYDDHDFGPNDADADSPTVDVARSSYRKNVPHYDLIDEPIYQSWVVGRVLFILTDIVSESSVDGTKMSETQTQWFFSELKRGRDEFKLTVWVSSKPWIGKLDPGSDSWLGHASERERISNFIADNSITSLIVVAGDAHMIAIDDGENTDYSVPYSNGTARHGAGFPILQAAPLDRGGSTKGGPFSHGCFAYRLHQNSQYGIVDVVDNGGEDVCVRMAGYRADVDEPVMEYSTCVPTIVVGKTGGGRGTCAIQLLPLWPLILLVCTLILIFGDMVFYVFVPVLFPKTRVGKLFSVSRMTRLAGAVVIVLTFGICLALNMKFGLQPWEGFQILFLVALFMPAGHMLLLRLRANGKLCKLHLCRSKICELCKNNKRLRKLIHESDVGVSTIADSDHIPPVTEDQDARTLDLPTELKARKFSY